jgi:hypothetical protein
VITVPHNGTEAEVAVMPDCDFCKMNPHLAEKPRKAEYDFRTKNGQWGYGCTAHYKLNRMHPDLGTGKGQRLVLRAV